jgi:MRG-binding protein
MISIHNDMRSHGFATEDAPHTRIPGIWRKLNQLYELDALDERENQYAFSEEPDPVDREEAANIPDFELPEDDFGELMWQKRFHRELSAAASSPAAMSIEDDKTLYHPGVGLLKDRPGKDRPGSARSQKAETPAEATPTPKNTKTTRASRANAKTTKGTRAGASATKGAKAQSTQSTVSESAEEEDEEDEDEESSAESEEDSAPTTRRTNRGRARQQQPAKRKGRK